MQISTIDEVIGHTPLVRLQRMGAKQQHAQGTVVLAKLEGSNPAGSVKDRTALFMVQGAEERGAVRAGGTLIEATSGNTGIALAMVAAVKGYRMVIVMPEGASAERVQTMKAYGAQVVLTARSGGMEGARDLAARMAEDGKGVLLNQFGNADNPRAHFETTGPEIWKQTDGRITHFVSAMGTTGTIVGVSRYLKQQNSRVRVIGAQPAEGAHIAGIRKWPEEYLPTIYDASTVDEILQVTQGDAEETARRLAHEEGIFCGISAGGAGWVAQRIADRERDATVVFVVPDRGDRYFSTGVFPV